LVESDLGAVVVVRGSEGALTLKIFQQRLIAWLTLFTFIFPNILWAQVPASNDETKAWKVIVIPPIRGEGVRESAGNQTGTYLETLLSLDDRFEVIPTKYQEPEPEAQAPPRPPPEPPKDPALEKADKLLWKARDLTSEGKVRMAVGPMRTVVGIYAQRFMNLEDLNPLIEAIYESAGVFFSAGKMSAAQQMLTILFTLRPNTAFQQQRTPPKLLEMVAATQEKMAKNLGGKLVISSKPENARIYVDGIDQGLSPTELELDVAGPHFVVARLDGYKPAGIRVNVPKRGRTKKALLRMRALPKPKVKKSRKGARNAKKKPSKLSTILPLLENGRIARNLTSSLRKFAVERGADFVIISHLSRPGDSIVFSPFIGVAEKEFVVPAAPIMMDGSLANMQVDLLSVPDALAAVLKKPRKGKAIWGVPRAWKVRPPPEPKKPVVIAPVPTPPIYIPKPATPVPAPPVRSTPPPPPPTPVAVVPPPPAPVAIVAPSGTMETQPSGPTIMDEKWFWPAVIGGTVLIAGAIALSSMDLGGDDEAGSYKATVMW